MVDGIILMSFPLRHAVGSYALSMGNMSETDPRMFLKRFQIHNPHFTLVCKLSFIPFSSSSPSSNTTRHLPGFFPPIFPLMPSSIFLRVPQAVYTTYSRMNLDVSSSTPRYSVQMSPNQRVVLRVSN